MTTSDFSLYAVLDHSVVTGRDPGALARQAIAGGATIIQYRDKAAGPRTLIAAVGRIVEALSGTGIPVIVNDRADVALAAGADGVHLGQDDLPPDWARRILGPDAIIGITVRTDAEAEETPLDSVDYVGLGGVFSTATKKNATDPIGLGGVSRISGRLRARKPDIAIVAIAGIDEDNAARVIAAGADGVAVVSALFGNGDVGSRARRLAEAVDRGRRDRRPQ